MNRIGYLLIPLSVVATSCNDSTTQTTSSADLGITGTVNEDLQDGISNITDWNFDLPEINKMKFVSDHAHSSISFHTKHWEIVNLIGWFEKFEVVMYADSINFSDAVIFAKVDARSIKMPNIKMEESVKKPPYLDTYKFPYVFLKDGKLKSINNNDYTLTGTFIMNGINKVISFDVVFNGYAYPKEKNICGFDISGAINRRDFKIAGDDQLHSGKAIHSDTIYISMSLRME